MITPEVSGNKGASLCAEPTADSSTVPGCEALVIDSVQPLVVGPGDTVTLEGRNLRPTLTLASIGTETIAPTSVSDSKATFVVPNEMKFGPTELTLTQDGVTQKVTVFANGGKTDHPIITAGADQICKGVTFYDVTGTLQTGRKNCIDLPECTSDGGTNCVATSSFPAANPDGVGARCLSGRTVAGIPCTVTLPAVNKVLTGTSYGAGGNGLTGTLTLPLAANTIAGSPVYGDPTAPRTPSYALSFPTPLVRPVAPTITGVAFNLAPDRVSISWEAVTGATGYIVLLRKAQPVSWTPTDGASYTLGTYGSDELIYAGSGTTVTHNTPVTAGATFYFAVYSHQGNQIYSYAPSTKTMVSCEGLKGGTWIAVPGDPIYQTDGFCVQKYVPSNVNGVPTSQPGTVPWVSISQISARTACSGLGPGYHLITNPEWMTIAANIANGASNWSGDVVGGGTLSRGHSDNSPPNACSADANDANAWVEGDCTGKAQGTMLFNQRRTQYLSTGAVIWDMGGNVWQWVDYNNASDKPTPATLAWHEFTAITGTATTPKSHLVPLNSAQSWWDDTWNSTQNIGRIYPGTNDGTSGALLRGASWGDGTNVGLFAAGLGSAPSGTRTNLGLRCAWQP